MRILHIGSGFRPLRRGGLVAYAEDLMDEQVRRGDNPSYFFSGRDYPMLNAPRLKRRARGRVALFEVVNSPLYDHGRQPELELAEPHIERMLERVLRETRPEVVHLHELAGLPTSVLDVIHAAGVPSIVTLQDYFPLCPTFRLLDSRGQVCLRREIGADCVATVAADPRPSGLLIDATVRYHLARLLQRVPPSRRDPLVNGVARVVGALEAARRQRRSPSATTDPSAFQRRREVNVERLNRVDRVIAMSHRVEEIYAMLGVDPERLRTLHLTLAHIERLRTRRAQPNGTVTFATLAAFESKSKGAHVVLDAMRRLAGHVGGFRLIVFGHTDPTLAEQARGVPGIELRGTYDSAEQDAILDEVDVGILPSVWEEAYGYAGLEFLAKGIPVIANAIGGMPDYTREGETGWLNRSCSGEELARIMAEILERPEQIVELNERLRAARDSIVKPMARHADEIESVYRDVLEARHV
jgi:glycosyltransferase involved in cell wall biosynthesis